MDAFCVTPYGRSVETLRDIQAADFISVYAKHLKANNAFKLPKWVDYVKTSVAKEMAPFDEDWLYIRAASILRHIYLRPKVGIGALRRTYGSKKRNGAAPGHFVKGGGKIIRYCVQQFQVMGILEQTETGRRVLSKRARKDLDHMAQQLAQVEEAAPAEEE
eukprot:Selendium_serpulae@DN3188_c0_g1_i1.p1